MAKIKASKTWAEQLADLEDPAPIGCYDLVLYTRSNVLQSLIQRTMPRKAMAQIQLAMKGT